MQICKECSFNIIQTYTKNKHSTLHINDKLCWTFEQCILFCVVLYNIYFTLIDNHETISWIALEQIENNCFQTDKTQIKPQVST